MENIYVVFDKKLGACDYVFTAVCDSLAVRIFDGFVVQSGTNIANCPEDFDLFSIGCIDLATCVISTHDRKYVCNAFDRKLLMQALHERRRLKLESLVGSLPSELLSSGSGSVADPSGSGSAAVPSGSGSAADASGSGSAADASGSGSAADASGSGSAAVVHESGAARVASVFGLAAPSESEVN